MSRYLSYLLRHNPASLGLTLDAEGFVPLGRLVSAIRRRKEWSWVEYRDVLEIQRSSDEKRFEIFGGYIRALYGHTTPSRIQHKEVVPPEILYHGTPRKNVQSILKEGILPMHRQYVHLSATAREAESVGLRRDEKSAVFRVLALEAYKNGVKFFRAGSLFLCGSIAPKFLQLIDESTSSEGRS